MMKLFFRVILAALFAAALAAPFAAFAAPSTIFVTPAVTSSSAMAPAPAPASLDLATARRLALASSASLHKAALAYDSAVLAEKAQAFKRLPSVSASAGGSLDYAGSGSLADRLGATLKAAASQTVYDGGKQAALVRSGGVAVRAAAEAVRSARLAAIGQADAAYYAALKAAAGVETAQADLDSARLRLSLAKAKAEAGVLSPSDRLQAEAEAAASESSLTKARKALASARARLASLTGMPSSFELAPLDFSTYDGLVARLVALDEEAGDRFSASILAMALAENPGLASYALASEKATIAIEAARAAYAPAVSVGLSQGLAWGAANGFSLGAGGVSVSGSLSLDFWNAANGVASAEAAAASAALDGAEGARSLALEIEVAANGLASAARTIGSSAKALEYAESGYRYELERFKLSAASAAELSAAWAQASANRTALIGARYDFLASVSELRALVGLESDEPITAAVP